jgi:hypothetical protein
LLQSLLECRDAGLVVRYARGHTMEYADAPHAVCRLRSRRERPRRRRSADKRDELATPHARPLILALSGDYGAKWLVIARRPKGDEAI